MSTLAKLQASFEELFGYAAPDANADDEEWLKFNVAKRMLFKRCDAALLTLGWRCDAMRCDVHVWLHGDAHVWLRCDINTWFALRRSRLAALRRSVRCDWLRCRLEM
jgi:hypothetical protein